MEFFERGEKHGEKIGEKRGEKRGKKKGEISLLQRLLEKRFGRLPSWVKMRLEKATLKELDTWSLQIFDANSLEDVFKD